ncbi:MAG: DNA polymerase III subunit delta' [Hyphomicrobiaceae bacterium]|nr:DNA polymerase III subunit delta' [Hyphomicrobiaceae bacterium]
MARAAAQEIEAIPEPDRLDRVPHPRETVRLFGHDAIERGLAEGFRQGRMHHAWLISGIEGVGKATLAYRFARHALSRPADRDPGGQSLEVAAEAPVSRQVRAQAHPGLLVIRRPWNHQTKRLAQVITVDEVRRLRSFLSHTSDTDSNRVVIVDTADLLNINAANALLKSLEEPPSRTFFLLLTSTPGRLLPTIRSRCRTLDLAPLDETNLRRAVLQALEAEKAEPPGPSDWTRLVALAEGSPRRALSLWLGDGLKLDGRLTQLFGSLPSLDWVAAHGLADELSSAAALERFEMLFDLLLKLLSRLVRAAAGLPASPEDSRLAARLIPEARLASWAELWETIAREKAEAQALNLDRKSLILGTFGRIEAAARR